MIQTGQIVRRADLYSTSSSPLSSPDPELEQLFRTQISRKIDIIPSSQHDLATEVQTSNLIESAGELDFRLFAVPSGDRNKVTKIRVKSPSEDHLQGSLVRLERPRGYYFRDNLSPEAEQKLRSAAVSGADVIARSKTPCLGCALPWRVTTLIIGRSGMSVTKVQPCGQNNTSQKTKKRKGKKTRIALRRKLAEERNKLESERTAALKKKLVDQTKKARRNREKQLKKRARDKAKLLAGDGTDTTILN